MDNKLVKFIRRDSCLVGHYKADGTITEVVEYEGRSHLMPAQTGWEEIADHALSWATEQAAVWAARSPLPASA